MAAKKRAQYSAKANASAKLEAVAKASFEHKKTVTEIIPPDVTRAKAGRWLDLISPITEWAGLKGDALKFQRQQLRIQQEAALEHLAQAVRAKMDGRKVERPLPPKILVPALEAASLESPTSPLIDWWADLLVSGATRDEVRPYLIDLMTKLGGAEAAFLNRVWVKYAAFPLYLENHRSVVEDVNRRLREFLSRKVNEIYEISVHDIREVIRVQKEIYGSHANYKKLCNDTKLWIDDKNNIGVGLRLTLTSGTDFSDVVIISNSLQNEDASVDICGALGLLSLSTDRVLGFGDLGLERVIGLRAHVTILKFTALGIAFMRACRPIDTDAPQI